MSKGTNLPFATVPPLGKQSLPSNLNVFVLLHLFSPIVVKYLFKFRGPLYFKVLFLIVVLFL